MTSDSMNREPVLVSWSGGKDSCMALQAMLEQPAYRVEALLTTITRDFDRISMHGVRVNLLRQQADSLGIRLQEISISKAASNAEYEAATGGVWETYRARGTNTVVFGDLFLQDIRAYRDRLLAKHAMTGLYPIWGTDTGGLIRRFIAAGFKTVVVCVDPKQLDPSFAGRVIDEQFVADLPANVDPCGENGEFHTFVFDGPIFRYPIRFELGEVVCRDGFWFCDLV
jgi:uncharacterized protein (TIGR00290 family)